MAAPPPAIVAGELVPLQTRQHVVALTYALPLVIRAVRARGYRFVTLKGIRPLP